MASKTFDVPKISCSGCEMTIKNALGKLGGIAAVQPSAVTKKVLVEFDPGAIDEIKIRDALRAAGYPAN